MNAALRVWVVDDDESIRWVLERSLSREGMRVESLRFVLDGDRISPDETSATLELVDGDQIDAVLFKEAD